MVAEPAPTAAGCYVRTKKTSLCAAFPHWILDTYGQANSDSFSSQANCDARKATRRVVKDF